MEQSRRGVKGIGLIADPGAVRFSVSFRYTLLLHRCWPQDYVTTGLLSAQCDLFCHRQIFYVTEETAMGRRIGYARVSTDDQDLSIQMAALDRDGCAIVFEEKLSGTRRDGRTQLELALKVLTKGDTLVVARLDRLGRSLRDLANIAHEIEHVRRASARHRSERRHGDLGRSRLLRHARCVCAIRDRRPPRASRRGHRQGQEGRRLHWRQAADRPRAVARAARAGRWPCGRGPGAGRVAHVDLSDPARARGAQVASIRQLQCGGPCHDTRCPARLMCFVLAWQAGCRSANAYPFLACRETAHRDLPRVRPDAAGSFAP